MIGIIDYNSGNIESIKNALARLNVPCLVSANPATLNKADKLIFPGVGRAGAAMKELKKRGLDDFIKNTTKPFLGICLGLQLLSKFSEEDNTKCLNIINSKVKKFNNNVKVPQIGWNRVKIIGRSLLTKNIPNNEYFYFVNSYYLEPDKQCSLATTNYGIEFSAIVKKNIFYGVQFHPEKSGLAGERLLNNFCKLC